MKTRSLALLMTFATVLATPASSQWRHSISTDEMTGERQGYAISPQVAATRGMTFPYADTRAWLGFGRDGKDEWAYVGFSKEPNLTNTQTHDGYNSFDTRAKWDDRIESTSFVQEWGSSSIHFVADSAAIANMVTAATMLLEISWYSEGSVYFRFSLRGSSAAVSRARTSCRT